LFLIQRSNNRGLEIDLTTQKSTEFFITDEERKAFIGGKGLGLKLLADRMPPSVDPLSPENHIAFLTGVLMGTGASCSGRFIAVSKSPLTNLFISSSCGGDFGTALKSIGYDVLIVKGASKTPINIVLTHESVAFQSADKEWGLDTAETQDRLALQKNDGIVTIGPAGENLVRFANVVSGKRFLGRGGLGAVMGSKKLKAIVVQGRSARVIPNDPERFKRINLEATHKIRQNEFTAYYFPEFGTNANMELNNTKGILPVENFQGTSSPEAEKLYTRHTLEQKDTKKSSCRTCPIKCGRTFINAEGKEQKFPEFETTALFGPNLGVYDFQRIQEWDLLCAKLGLDTISTAGVLAYVTEATREGILQTNLEFGKVEPIQGYIHQIAYLKGLGAEMAFGVAWMAEKYGGVQFANQVKGMEFPAYHPGNSWGQGLAYAVSNRGACHMSATLFPLEAYKDFMKPRSRRGKARFVSFFEDLYSVINSLSICVFTSFPFLLEDPLIKITPLSLLRFVIQLSPLAATLMMDLHIFAELFSSITGIEIDQFELRKIGRRISTLQRWLNTREGISRKDDTLPERFLDKDSPLHIIDFESMLEKYYHIRGWDNNGIPTRKTMVKLGLQDYL
jgi:aldehyde:ferredoxin oxidoreductase